MDITKSSIYRLLTSSNTYVIPVYQRPYEWKKEQCEQMMKDIWEIARNLDAFHFFGCIVYRIQNREKMVIIDGQQRFTSILLLLKAIHDCTQDKSLQARIYKSFLTNPYSTEKTRRKLYLTWQDEKLFSKLIDIKKINDQAFDHDERDTSLYRNYCYFKEQIQNLISRNQPVDRILDALDRLEVAEIALRYENPQVIFESLNSTGLELTNVDLIRNYFLMPMDYQEQELVYEEYWKEIERMIGTASMEDFFLDYLIMERRTDSLTDANKKLSVNKRSLYKAYQKLYDRESFHPEDARGLLQRLYHFACYYKHFIYDSSTNYEKLEKIDQKLFELFYLVGESRAASICMSLFEMYEKKCFDTDSFCALIQIMISFAFRSKVCGSSGITGQFAGLVLQRINEQDMKKDPVHFFLEAITSGRGGYAFPTDDRFREELCSRNIYESLHGNGCRYLLYSLEKRAPKGVQLPSYQNASVEHIMPRTITKEWKNALNDNEGAFFEKSLHTLGNLTLSDLPDNIGMSNKSFSEKCLIYRNSNFYYTQQLTTYQKWTYIEIDRRGRELASEALRIWELPSKYNAMLKLDSGINYSLSTMFTGFTGTHPDILYLIDEQVKVKSWVSFTETILQKLLTLDHSIAQELVDVAEMDGKSVFFATDDGSRNLRKVDFDLYFEGTNSQKKLLQLAKLAVSYYDRTRDSDYMHAIRFTVQPN